MKNKSLKKVIIAVLILLICFLLLVVLLFWNRNIQSAYSPDRLASPVQIRETTPEIMQQNDRVLEIINNDLALTELITEDMSEWDFIGFHSEFGILVTRYNENHNRRMELYEINDLLGIEALRRKGNGDVYAVFEVENEGRIFLFFQQNQNYQLTHTITVPKSTAEYDFDMISVGDLVSQHRSLFRALGGGRVHVFYNERSRILNYFLFEDLLVIIHEEFENGTEAAVVVEIERHSDKIIYFPVGAEINGRLLEYDEVFDFNILPQDFPNR